MVVALSSVRVSGPEQINCVRVAHYSVIIVDERQGITLKVATQFNELSFGTQFLGFCIGFK